MFSIWNGRCMQLFADIGHLLYELCVHRTVLLMLYFADPWMMAFSNSQRRKYLFNTQTREAIYHTPKDAVAPFK